MSFNDFIGNEPAVRDLRQMLANGRFPHAVILAGAEGAGKFTLAQMLAKAVNCLDPPKSSLPDFCGVCEACRRTGEADDLEGRCAEALEARENLRETDKKETRLFIQTHPDVLIIPPDPPQMMIKVDQVRRVTETIYFRPSQGRRKIYIFTDSCFIKEAANALLKVLEEPPDYAHILVLTPNPGELIPTIRSRCIAFQLASLPVSEIESVLTQRQAGLAAERRSLVARLSGGAVGRALAFDLAAYLAQRADALALLNAGKGGDHGSLFQATESYRAGAEGKAKTEGLLRTMSLLLQDVLYIKEAAPELIRNIDIAPGLRSLAAEVGFEWIEQASRGIDTLETGMRRNPLRSLALDSFALSLEK